MVDICWLVVASGGCILADSGWWWVMVDIFWLMVDGGGYIFASGDW